MPHPDAEARESLNIHLDFATSDFSESQFFVELARRSGCDLLLDVNNLMVNARNAAEHGPLLAVCGRIDEAVRSRTALVNSCMGCQASTASW